MNKCEELCRFWNIHPDDVPISVVVSETSNLPERRLIISKIRPRPIRAVVEMTWEGPLIGSTSEDLPVRLFIPFIDDVSHDGSPLAYFCDGNVRRPAITQKGGVITFYFDPEETLLYMMSHYMYWNRRPVLSYLPYQWVPGDLRRLIVEFLSRRGDNRLPTFPSWPIERSVESIRRIFLAAVRLVDPTVRYRTDFWPNGKSYAVALTHDVDSLEGLKSIPEILSLEEERGLPSSWNFVFHNVAKSRKVLDMLRDRERELGLHGYNHDNKDAFLSEKQMRQRFNDCQSYLNEYGVDGFRSPSWYVSKRLFNILPDYVLYDCSVCDTLAFYVNKAYGACTVFPFPIGRLIEVPTTIPFEVAGSRGTSPDKTLAFWVPKIEWLKTIGGIIVVDTHPEPWYSGAPQMIRAYERLLTYLAGDSKAWYTTPRDIADWYRRHWGA